MISHHLDGNNGRSNVILQGMSGLVELASHLSLTECRLGELKEPLNRLVRVNILGYGEQIIDMGQWCRAAFCDSWIGSMQACGQAVSVVGGHRRWPQVGDVSARVDGNGR
jgi:hypothetical protein